MHKDITNGIRALNALLKELDQHVLYDDTHNKDILQWDIDSFLENESKTIREFSVGEMRNLDGDALRDYCKELILMFREYNYRFNNGNLIKKLEEERDSLIEQYLPISSQQGENVSTIQNKISEKRREISCYQDLCQAYQYAQNIQFKNNFREYVCLIKDWVEEFATAISTLLSTKGIDLSQIEQECNVYLLQEHNIDEVNIKQSFPKELDTDKAQGLIKKAIEAGYITVEAGQYKWNREKVLLAYFAFRASTYLGLKVKYKACACWKPFESLFKETNLKGAKADFEKYHTDFYPTDCDGIDTLFEADTECQK